MRARFSVALGVPSLPTVTPNPTPLDAAPEASDPRSRGEGQAERPARPAGTKGQGFWTDYPDYPLGYALLEEVVLEEGVSMTTSFASYLIPSAADVADVEAVVVESGEGLGPFGARGIGEPPIGPPAAAVANAIEDATGVRVTRLPLTGERVARGLGLVD